MEFITCNKYRDDEEGVFYEVSFKDASLEDARGIACQHLCRNAGIDWKANAEALARLNEAFGQETISRFIDEFCENYVACAIAETLDFYPFGRPRIVERNVEQDSEGAIVSLKVGFRRTPSYPLCSYDPLEIEVGEGEIDLESKAKLVNERLLAMLDKKIDVKDLQVCLEDETAKFFAMLEEKDMSVERYCKKGKTNEEGLRRALVKTSLQKLTEEMALDALYRKLGLSYSDEDMRQVLLRINPDDPKAAWVSMQKTNITHQAKQAAERQCARRWLMTTARFVAPAPSEDAAQEEEKPLDWSKAFAAITSGVEKAKAEAAKA